MITLRYHIDITHEEDIMEILFDFFLEIIFDGSLLLGESRRVPLAVRIIAAVAFTVMSIKKVVSFFGNR